MALTRPIAVWPRVQTVQGRITDLTSWAKSLIRQMDLSLVHGAPAGLIGIDGVHFQEPLTATADPLVFTAPFDVAVQAPRPTNLPDAPSPGPSPPLATVALLSGAAVTIVPWSATYPPPAGFWTLHADANQRQTVALGSPPGVGTSVVFLVAVLA